MKDQTVPTQFSRVSFTDGLIIIPFGTVACQNLNEKLLSQPRQASFTQSCDFRCVFTNKLARFGTNYCHLVNVYSPTLKIGPFNKYRMKSFTEHYRQS